MITTSLIKISDFGKLELTNQTMQEIEFGLLNVDPGRFEDCEKICKFSPEVQKTIKDLTKGSQCSELQDKIAKLLGYAKRKDGSIPLEKKNKLQEKIEKTLKNVQSLLGRVSEDARNAFIFITLRDFYRIGKEFNLQSKTLEKLKSDFWKGLSSTVAAVALGVTAGICLAGIPLVGGLIAASLFLGFGIYKLGCYVKSSDERKKLEAYKKVCEEMLRKGFVNESQIPKY